LSQNGPKKIPELKKNEICTFGKWREAREAGVCKKKRWRAEGSIRKQREAKRKQREAKGKQREAEGARGRQREAEGSGGKRREVEKGGGSRIPVVAGVQRKLRGGRGWRRNSFLYVSLSIYVLFRSRKIFFDDRLHEVHCCPPSGSLPVPFGDQCLTPVTLVQEEHLHKREEQEKAEQSEALISAGTFFRGRQAIQIFSKNSGFFGFFYFSDFSLT
jgi:hypothetical protein